MKRSALKRSAFTLVELLVVIVIIGLLAGILMAATQAAREAARRGQCISRQRDLAIAMVAYSTANDGLPGYLNQQGSLPIHSWAVVLFPEIGETKRYEVLMKRDPNANEMRQAAASLPALLCPSDNPKEELRLNYAVNCGPSARIGGITGDNAPHFTLFKDRRSALAAFNKKVPIENIPDGAGNTILLSENVDARIARVWLADWGSFLLDSLESSMLNGQPIRSRVAVENLGFVWTHQNDFLPNAPAVGNLSDEFVNNIPRPSSRHPGTVVVAYADGKSEAINDDIAVDVWLRLVCPDDAKARLAPTAGGLGLTGL